MVSGATPYFDLDVVKAAVKANAIGFTKKCVHDYSNLGYETSDVARCLLALETEHFHKRHNYNGLRCDAYRIRVENPFYNGLTQRNRYDDLYVKLTLRDGRLFVTLLSFHLS